MKQPFKTEDLRAELERTLGFRMAKFMRLKCVNSINFKAVRADDGFAFTVKCLPPERRIGYQWIVRHLDELRGTLAPQRVFERECPLRFGAYDLICLAWCEGMGMFPDRLTEDQLIRFLDDYLDFSKALQRTTLHHAPYPSAKWRDEALAASRAGWGRLVRPVIEMCAMDESAFRPELSSIQHGDLHPGNFAFSNGRVSGFFDIEGLTEGYPAWDLVRYFVFALDHLRFYERHRGSVILRRFATAVRHLPYSREEWIVSLNVSWLEQVYKKMDRMRFGPFAALQLRLHARLYRRLRKVVEENLV